jgi:soluble lytic murein transglycosylase-like protein
VRSLTALLCVLLVWSVVVENAAAATTPVPLRAATFRQGAARYAQGRLREAEAIFGRLTRQAPRDPQAWLWLGIVRYRTGDHPRAAAAFEAAHRLAPRDARTLLWWGHALLRAGYPAAAEATFRRTLLATRNRYVHELAEQALRAMRPAPELPAGEEARDVPSAPLSVSVERYSLLARHYNPRLTLGEAEIIAQSLLAFSRQYNIDPRLIVALVVIESGFQPRARSRAGALGLGQLMPATARAMGVDPYDPSQNLYGTIRYLRGNLDHFGWHNVHLALAAYNAGRGAVERYEGIPPYDETRWYVYNVSNLYRRLLSL